MKTVLLVASILMSSLMASAQTNESPAWVCSMNFNGVRHGVQVILGFSEFKGAGTLSCTSRSGEKSMTPIKVTMKSTPIAARISVGRLSLYGESLHINLDRSRPQDLLGEYLVAQGQAAIIGGLGVINAVRVANHDLSLAVSMQVVHGFGLDLGFSKMKIELDKAATAN